MQDGLVDLLTGLLVGGLAMSACWGLFWLAIGTVGLARGTCSWRVVLNSSAVLMAPLFFSAMLLWFRGPSHAAHGAFLIGLGIMPLIVIGLGWRQAPDGQRAGAHMLGGVRHLMDELTGKHRGCGGCSHEHEHEHEHEHGGCP